MLISSPRTHSSAWGQGNFSAKEKDEASGLFPGTPGDRI